MEILSSLDLYVSRETETEKIQLLVFSISSTKFGVDLDGIYQILDLEQANQRECHLVPFEKIFSFGAPVSYQSPMALLRKENPSAGIMIDQVEKVAPVNLNAIKPLPPLLKRYKNNSSVIWGTALIENEVVLLVEFI